MMARLQRLGTVVMWPIRTLTAPGSDLRARILRNASIGLVGSVLTMLAGVARTVFLARTIPVADYGRILIVVNLVAVLKLFLDIRLNDVLYRFVPAFERNRDVEALRGLLLSSIAIATATGLVITVGILALAGWLETWVYGDPGLGTLFRIYAIAALFLAFDGVYTAILRLRNRFVAVMVPQVLGATATLAGLVALRLIAPHRYALPAIVLIFLAGTVVQAVPPLVSSLREVRKFLTFRRLSTAIKALRGHRQQLRSSLVQTNLAAYLKLGADTGGIFLLGVFAAPAQVGIYGLARQFITPVTTLQTNIQAAIAPEIMTLYAHREIDRLAHLVRRVTKGIAIVGGLGLVIAYPLVAPVIGIVARPDYADAAHVVYVLLPATYVVFVSLAYYPLALAMDRLGRRNLIVAIRFIYLGVAVGTGLDAVRLALVQLSGAITTRVLNDLPLMRSLRRQGN